MKTSRLLFVATAFVMTLSVSAQRNQTIKKIADMQGVESTYFTKEYNDSKKSEFQQAFDSSIYGTADDASCTYIIDADEEDVIKKVKPLLKSITENSDYKLLMRTKDDDEVTSVYALPNKNKEGYKERIMITVSNDELSIIYREW